MRRISGLGILNIINDPEESDIYKENVKKPYERTVKVMKGKIQRLHDSIKDICEEIRKADSENMEESLPLANNGNEDTNDIAQSEEMDNEMSTVQKGPDFDMNWEYDLRVSAN